MRGRNGTVHRYYHCPKHDVLRAGSDDRRRPGRNIRANELDKYVFEQVRHALLDPQQLLEAERAVIAATPDQNRLVATQLKRLGRAIAATGREDARLLDAYQAGLLELNELTRRTATLTPAASGSSTSSTRSLSDAPSWPPSTDCAAGSLPSRSASPHH